MKIRAIKLSASQKLVFSRIKKNTAISAGGSVVLLVLSILRMVLLTRLYLPVDYGKLLVVINLYYFLNVLLGLRINDFIYRLVPAHVEENDFSNVGAVIKLAFFLSLISSSIVFIIAFFGEPLLEHLIFSDAASELSLKYYALAGFIAGFEGFYTGILRVIDKFRSIVIPQVIGSLISFAILLVVSQSDHGLSLNSALLILSLSVLIGGGLSLLLALRTTRSWIVPSSSAIRYFIEHRRAVLSLLFQTNLVGYLKLSGESGALLLLGKFAGSGEVAIYGLAKQLAGVFQFAQNLVNSVLAPEIANLWSRKEFKILKSRVDIFIGVVFGALILSAPILILFTEPVVTSLFGEEYRPAIAIFAVLFVAYALNILSSPFYTLSIMSEELGRRNLITSYRFIYLLIATVMGLSAFTLALVQLAGSITLRLLHDLVMWNKLKRLSL